MRESTERALRWFLRKEAEKEIFTLENRMAQIRERGESPPEETAFEHGFIKGLAAALKEEPGEG